MLLQPRHFRARQKSSEVGKHNQLSNDDHHQLQNQLNLHNDYQSNSQQTSAGSNHTQFKLQQNQQMKCPSGAMSSDSEDDDDSRDGKKSKISSSVISIKEESGLNNNHHNESTSGIAVKRRKSEEDQNSDSMDIKSEMSKNDANLPRKKNAVRSQLAQQIMQSSNKQLKKPIYPVRPAGPSSSSSPIMSSYYHNLALDQKLLLKVFKYLPQDTLVACSLVCKAWAQVNKHLFF